MCSPCIAGGLWAQAAFVGHFQYGGGCGGQLWSQVRLPWPWLHAGSQQIMHVSVTRCLSSARHIQPATFMLHHVEEARVSMLRVCRAPRQHSGSLRPCCWLRWAQGVPASGGVLPCVQVRTGHAQ